MNLFRSINVLILCFILSGIAVASSGDQSRLENDLKNYQTQKANLIQELEFTQSKRDEAQKSLANLQMELKSKEIQLDKMKASLGKTPTPEQQDFIANEENRIELGEAAVKTRKAALSRLERKERSISKKIARADALSEKAKEQISSLEQQDSSEAQAATSAKAYRIQRELEELKKENEQLRIAMAEEALRTREANDEAKRLEQLAKERALELKKIADKKAEEAQKIADASQPNTDRAGSDQLKLSTNRQKKSSEIVDESQTVLPGELPIYKKNDGKRVVIRNRGVRQTTVMEPVGDKIFRAEVVLEPGKSYFDVRKRRYRGYFPEKDGIATYVFYYDLTDEEQPKLSVTRKSEDDINQMISNAKDPF